jgi:hypothetical protein
MRPGFLAGTGNRGAFYGDNRGAFYGDNCALCTDNFVEVMRNDLMTQ